MGSYTDKALCMNNYKGEGGGGGGILIQIYHPSLLPVQEFPLPRSFL